MFLPLRDQPNPGGTPFVNYALIAINVVVFLALSLPLMGQAPDITQESVQGYLRFLSEQTGRPVRIAETLSAISAYDVFVFEHGFKPAQASVATLFSSMFLHGGFMHLAGNMLFLWIYGDNVEHRLGSGRYLGAYLLTGVAATLFHAAFDMSSNIPMVGASGAISGVLGFYFLLFPRNTVNVFVVLFPILVDVVTIPARIVLGAYLIVDNIFPALFSSGGGVAHGAHIGGFLAGLGAAFLLDRREVAATPAEYRNVDPDVPPPAPRRRPRATTASASPGALVSQLIDEGRMADAAKVYFGGPDGPESEPEPRDALVLGRWLAENGHPTAALTVFRRVLKVVPSGEVAAWAHLGAGLVQLEEMDRPTAAYQHFLDAIDLTPSGPVADQARAGLAEIDARA